ncbi:hypothetical protein AX16_006641 [Volvariella volvacea WC 439]|nr:hypothetical protein AX16_006641 [Volvariella volvacea WC 439]
MQDASVYPEFGGPRRNAPISVISISSSSSDDNSASVVSTATSSTVTASLSPPRKPPVKAKSRVVISSDEEDDDDSVVQLLMPQPQIPKAAPEQPKAYPPAYPTPKLPVQSKPIAMPTPIHIPSNRDLTKTGSSSSLQHTRHQPDEEEAIVMPNLQLEPFDALPPAEAEKALRDLVSGAMDAQIEVTPEDAYVNGFRDGIKLLPHQIIGRKWMSNREDITKKRMGGILADDMGLGKTIQTLTTIVGNRARKADKHDGFCASTLVIAPLALVKQWQEEIARMAVGLQTLIHHGTNRTTDSSVLAKNHVVITTYDVVKSEFEVFSSEDGKPSGGKGRKKKESSQRDDDEDSDESLPSLKKSAKKKCALFGLKWWRIVLDEAHNIKNEKTKGAIACCALEGKFRWCLTGTPMQNNVTEIYSLLKFLRIKPLNDWTTFNEQIAKPVKSGKGATRAIKRLQVVLKQVMLRRQKDQTLNGQPLIKLPGRHLNIVPCTFDASEKAFYDALEAKMEDVLAKLTAQEKKGSAYMSVLLLLLRLRQACNHPMLVVSDYKADMEAVEPRAAKKGADEDDPGADADDLAAAFGQLGVTRKCQVCTVELTSSNTADGEWNNHCIDCVVLARQAKESRVKRPTSAKIRMILKILRDINERSDGEEKTIIFSQFTTMLDLIEPFLKEEGVVYVRYDGSMKADKREFSLDKIKNDERTKVILISFKAGSTGLNLTACNNVILVDLWWNPALEDQAFDRAHRFGQTRDVNIFKLKINETVEDRILELQEKKRALARAALSGDKIKNQQLTMDDLLALFRPGGRGDDEEDYD